MSVEEELDGGDGRPVIVRLLLFHTYTSSCPPGSAWSRPICSRRRQQIGARNRDGVKRRVRVDHRSHDLNALGHKDAGHCTRSRGGAASSHRWTVDGSNDDASSIRRRKRGSADGAHDANSWCANLPPFRTRFTMASHADEVCHGIRTQRLPSSRSVGDDHRHLGQLRPGRDPEQGRQRNKTTPAHSPVSSHQGRGSQPAIGERSVSFSPNCCRIVMGIGGSWLSLWYAISWATLFVSPGSGASTFNSSRSC